MVHPIPPKELINKIIPAIISRGINIINANPSRVLESSNLIAIESYPIDATKSINTVLISKVIIDIT